MKFALISLLLLISGCGSSKKESNTEDIVRDKSYYHSNHSCDRSDEELDQFKWFSKKSYSKIESSPPQKRKPSSDTELYEMIGKGCDDLDRQEIDEIARLTSAYGRELISPMSYENTVEDLQNYLDDIGGIQNFSAEEMTRPYHQHVAKGCGLDILLPINCRWAGAIAKGLLAEKLREIINQDNNGPARIIRLRNWFRPKCYNQHPTVGGVEDSDHRWSRGFDLDFANAHDRARAQRYLCQIYKERPFNLQVGIGCRSLHIGVGSPNGTRFWTYGTLRTCSLKRLEGDNCWRETSNGDRYIYTDQDSHGAL